MFPQLIEICLIIVKPTITSFFMPRNKFILTNWNDYLWRRFFCQTLGLVLRLRVDFVLPLSQEEQEQEEQEQEEQPLTKIYQKGVY